MTYAILAVIVLGIVWLLRRRPSNPRATSDNGSSGTTYASDSGSDRQDSPDAGASDGDGGGGSGD